ncbi:hypothetical protein P154DRAFT_533352 [Amniculicola lignicola CBS 123094]|uniref:Uncharacterized protein n=1 Tax=Amniculicola lignicola CBS 123094 TaxID=1392246 RepID=A0A6A5WKA4_9PLEO|nr:hypothetical protein P154DRAFT_533352 [Amniculicola lignicola CBS 123094]
MRPKRKDQAGKPSGNTPSLPLREEEHAVAQSTQPPAAVLTLYKQPDVLQDTENMSPSASATTALPLTPSHQSPPNPKVTWKPDAGYYELPLSKHAYDAFVQQVAEALQGVSQAIDIHVTPASARAFTHQGIWSWELVMEVATDVVDKAIEIHLTGSVSRQFLDPDMVPRGLDSALMLSARIHAFCQLVRRHKSLADKVMRGSPDIYLCAPIRLGSVMDAMVEQIENQKNVLETSRAILALPGPPEIPQNSVMVAPTQGDSCLHIQSGSELPISNEALRERTSQSSGYAESSEETGEN